MSTTEPHAFEDGDVVMFEGDLPASIRDNTPYSIRNASKNDFEISATKNSPIIKCEAVPSRPRVVEVSEQAHFAEVTNVAAVSATVILFYNLSEASRAASQCFDSIARLAGAPTNGITFCKVDKASNAVPQDLKSAPQDGWVCACLFLQNVHLLQSLFSSSYIFCRSFSQGLAFTSM
jgi:hypothetical protein